ncbi:hypothetical protein CcaverHIS002_0207000 [Cutaneotrichosporon cavernicola]|uniref:Uncharacterized protein n=1 Tax=Cutaneotrichosporon cavernicola TaxID=279322 RepID=A0AA48I4T2_9TREE|nr:uncharacterized protein CcaverHIS019_0206990 [Cutaneotrichosporon cavernicola]BEI81540.1 hypothetical protein CcaverHIS002_0207000 [Cutaneotrichosporon cavernicola]BEI89337.1 hypothetical protein CcaverHIS019_0206990 [Cutaneotrichosporon cavernicola]BEI97112.1 hypothetical protein CcaverHIS631_0207010 [Cutaneotrichosporon cavernicola]BEJ04885.1 hypothetical protein CcaverHIS641_0207020 [Cutaneotrichosporon cavernicola]
MPSFLVRLTNPRFTFKPFVKSSEKENPMSRIDAFPGLLEFPCKNWDGVDFPYPGPQCTYREKAIWAGRAASKRFAWAFENNDFFFVDNIDFAVAVFDKTQELLRYLARSAKECDMATTEEWTHFTDRAYNAIQPHLICLPPPRRFTLIDVYPFVRPAVNAQFEFGTGYGDQPPSAASCQFDDRWVARYFPEPHDLPLRFFTMEEINQISVDATGFIEDMGWYNYKMQRCITPSVEEQERPIPQDGDWPPAACRLKDYEAHLDEPHAPFGYSVRGYPGKNPSTHI